MCTRTCEILSQKLKKASNGDFSGIYRADCQDLFSQVEDIVQRNPQLSEKCGQCLADLMKSLQKRIPFEGVDPQYSGKRALRKRGQEISAARQS